MTITTKHLIETQIPLHIREENPVFTKFLEYYYEFLEGLSIPQIIQGIKSYTDIDAVEEAFLVDFFEEFRKFPSNIVADKRLVAKFAHDLYKTKGSEESLRMLFRILFNEEIDVRYPSENILRASSGKWVQYSFIKLATVSGDIDVVEASSGFILPISNSYGNFSVPIERTEKVSDTEIRLYFRSFQRISFNLDDIIHVEELGYTGKVVPSISGLEILAPGQKWQKGQVFTIQGTHRDTIVRVTNVDASGGILTTEIIEYGHSHNLSQITVISPYPNKPTGSSSFDITSTVINVTPLAYSYQLTIHDYTDGVADRVIGSSNILDASSYFLEQYTNDSYADRIVINTLTTADNSASNIIVDPSLTIEQWLASRATLAFKTSVVSTTLGYYKDDSGKLSNPNIRLQDNFFYQLFSYVISSGRDISTYREALALIHPAGMKMFSEYNLESRYMFIDDISAYATTSIGKLEVLDIVDVSEESTLDMTKGTSDTSTVSDSVLRVINKALADTATATETSTKSTSTTKFDTTTATDAIVVSGTKPLGDNVTSSDLFAVGPSLVKADSVTATENLLTSPTKYITDTVSSTDGTASISVGGYGDPTYFAEAYDADAYVVTIS